MWLVYIEGDENMEKKIDCKRMKRNGNKRHWNTKLLECAHGTHQCEWKGDGNFLRKYFLRKMFSRVVKKKGRHRKDGWVAKEDVAIGFYVLENTFAEKKRSLVELWLVVEKRQDTYSGRDVIYSRLRVWVSKEDV